MFSEVQREETPKRVMLSPTKTTVLVPSGDNSNLAARGFDEAHGDARGDTHNTRRSGNLWCEHCQRSNHNRENCWNLYGKPQNLKDNKGNRSISQNLEDSRLHQNLKTRLVRIC